MTQTYPAVLRDGRIEWLGEPPAGLPAGIAVPCEITLPLPAETAEAIAARKARRRAAMEALAAGGGVRSIPDPVAWQREQREDRSLPGRPE